MKKTIHILSIISFAFDSLFLIPSFFFFLRAIPAEYFSIFIPLTIFLLAGIVVSAVTNIMILKDDNPTVLFVLAGLNLLLLPFPTCILLLLLGLRVLKKQAQTQSV